MENGTGKRKKWDGSIAIRALVVLKLISEKPRSVAELQEALERDARFFHHFSNDALYDDRKRLEEAGFNIKYDGRIKKYRLISMPFCLGMDGEEALALAIAADAILSQDKLPYRPELASAMAKLKEVLAPEVIKGLETSPLVKFILRPVVDYRPFLDTIEDIRQALAWHRRIDVDYVSPHSGTSKHTLEPYELYFDHGALYLEAYSRQANDILVFRIDRIANLKVLPDRFEPTRKRATFTLKFKLDAEIAKLDGDRFPGQTVEIIDDEVALVTAEVSSRFWAMRQILSYGELAEVLEPEDLRAHMKQITEKMFKKYQD
ncbi:MAG: WYL domain-containing protein [Actinobacteria bacterium]|nr:WYL domain-containing protein [Actinomycetota bacterium]